MVLMVLTAQSKGKGKYNKMWVFEKYFKRKTFVPGRKAAPEAFERKMELSQR